MVIILSPFTPPKDRSDAVVFTAKVRMFVTGKREAMLQIAQIVPPTTGSCGVEDFAKLLAKSWQEQGIASGQVHSLRSGNGGLLAVFQGSVHRADTQSIVLHYSGYGYARRGAPFWLARASKQFRKRHPDIPWLTMFHEVAASGPIHTSAFWMRPLQLWVAKSLFEISDEVLTNSLANSDLLREAVPQSACDIRIVPVFSNFGEPATLVPPRGRQAQLVIFTSNFGGRNPPADFWQYLAQTITRYQISKLLLIGRPVNSVPEFPVAIQQLGFLDTTQISDILRESLFGYAFFAPLVLGKSGIFAAFAAHGVIPLVPVEHPMLPDGLVAGLHYSRCSDDPGLNDFETIQAGLLEWYRSHNLQTTSAMYAEILEGLASWPMD